MKKKIVSFLKNSQTKFFVLGIVLAVIISFSLSALASPVQTYKFIQSESGLVSRIGSLSVNQEGTASWINPKGWHSGKHAGKRESCLTTYGLSDKNEVESCLDVKGPGAFSKIITLDIPTFIYSTLFIGDSSSFGNITGLPSGLILEDDSNSTNNSILAAGLQRNGPDGKLAPRDLTSQRNLCADKITGKLYPCGGTVSYSCTGTTPSHAIMCQGDDNSLTSDVDKTLVTSCSSPTGSNPKCEYICDTNSGYHYDSSSKTCVVDDTYHWDTGDWGQCHDHYCKALFSGFDETCNPIDNQLDCKNQLGTPLNDPEQPVCEWAPLTHTSRFRTVNCVNQNGIIVADSNCDANTRPNDTQGCTGLVIEDETSCPDGKKGKTITAKIVGEPNEVVAYTAEVNRGHAADAYVTYNGNEIYTSPGNVTLNASGEGTVVVSACGGVELPCGSGNGDASAKFKITETGASISLIGHGDTC